MGAGPALTSSSPTAANLVVTDGNTVLSPEEVEMLSVLRINRRFMELCRSKFAKEAKQQFNQTIIEAEGGCIALYGV